MVTVGFGTFAAVSCKIAWVSIIIFHLFAPLSVCYHSSPVKVGVLIVVLLRMKIIWDVMLCHVVCGSQHFEGT